MNENHQKLDEDILGLTGSEEWQTFLIVLEAEGNAAVSNQLEAETWDLVNYQRGYIAALRFVANIRETTKILIEQAEANADV